MSVRLEMRGHLLVLGGQARVVGNGCLEGSQEVHLALELPLEDLHPLPLGGLVLTLDHDLEVVPGGVVGLDLELQGVARVVPAVQGHLVHLKH